MGMSSSDSQAGLWGDVWAHVAADTTDSEVRGAIAHKLNPVAYAKALGERIGQEENFEYLAHLARVEQRKRIQGSISEAEMLWWVGREDEEVHRWLAQRDDLGLVTDTVVAELGKRVVTWGKGGASAARNNDLVEKILAESARRGLWIEGVEARSYWITPFDTCEPNLRKRAVDEIVAEIRRGRWVSDRHGAETSWWQAVAETLTQTQSGDGENPIVDWVGRWNTVPPNAIRGLADAQGGKLEPATLQAVISRVRSLMVSRRKSENEIGETVLVAAYLGGWLTLPEDTEGKTHLKSYRVANIDGRFVDVLGRVAQEKSAMAGLETPFIVTYLADLRAGGAWVGEQGRRRRDRQLDAFRGGGDVRWLTANLTRLNANALEELRNDSLRCEPLGRAVLRGAADPQSGWCDLEWVGQLLERWGDVPWWQTKALPLVADFQVAEWQQTARHAGWEPPGGAVAKRILAVADEQMARLDAKAKQGSKLRLLRYLGENRWLEGLMSLGLYDDVLARWRPATISDVPHVVAGWVRRNIGGCGDPAERFALCAELVSEGWEGTLGELAAVVRGT